MAKRLRTQHTQHTHKQTHTTHTHTNTHKHTKTQGKTVRVMLGKDVHKGIRRAKRTLALQGETDLFALDGARPVFIICDSGLVLVCFVVGICAPERNIQAIAESHTGGGSVCVCV